MSAMATRHAAGVRSKFAGSIEAAATPRKGGARTILASSLKERCRAARVFVAEAFDGRQFKHT